MATLTISELKKKFKSGNVPTEDHFAQLIELANTGSPLANAHAGLKGLSLDEQNRLQVSFKHGLALENNQLQLQLSKHSGLTLNKTGLSVNVGSGLSLNQDNQLTLKVNTSPGLEYDSKKSKLSLNIEQLLEASTIQKGLPTSDDKNKLDAIKLTSTSQQIQAKSLCLGNGFKPNQQALCLKLTEQSGLSLNSQGLAINTGPGLKINESNGVSVHIKTSKELSYDQKKGVLTVQVDQFPEANTKHKGLLSVKDKIKLDYIKFNAKTNLVSAESLCIGKGIKQDKQALSVHLANQSGLQDNSGLSIQLDPDAPLAINEQGCLTVDIGKLKSILMDFDNYEKNSNGLETKTVAALNKEQYNKNSPTLFRRLVNFINNQCLAINKT
ncbi:hypothetical protein [Spartinivicinus poritis]|uniref:Uncharacterized protein n=1 Tax=Spartinivicinus poritis TaxID=2994640 RepID=A0ABT5UGB1_9GAMM|nr:hypothetical protein [Spartinivicinus sp. A2-2]MDE1465031.1 hypothetical protein [Spartinivicinus sp. A2-2]